MFINMLVSKEQLSCLCLHVMAKDLRNQCVCVRYMCARLLRSVCACESKLITSFIFFSYFLQSTINKTPCEGSDLLKNSEAFVATLQEYC